MFLSPPPESEDTTRMQSQSREGQGFVMNLVHAWAWRPDVYDGFAALRSRLTSHSTLGVRELAVIVSATASALGDSYCALAWGKKLADASSPETAAAVLREAGLSEREIAEATMFAAFRVAFSTFNDALGLHPDWELAETAPAVVVQAASFGRAPAHKPADTR